MAAIYDIIIRDGLVADGGGGAPYSADIAVSDGRIAAIGAVDGAGAKEIDARGNAHAKVPA